MKLLLVLISTLSFLNFTRSVRYPVRDAARLFERLRKPKHSVHWDITLPSFFEVSPSPLLLVYHPPPPKSANCLRPPHPPPTLKAIPLMLNFFILIPISTNLTKRSNTQSTCRQKPTNCLSVFDHFVRLALRGLTTSHLLKVTAILS